MDIPDEGPRSSPLGWMFVSCLYAFGAILTLSMAVLNASGGHWGKCISFTVVGAIGGFGSWVGFHRYGIEKRRKADAEALRWPEGGTRT